MSKKKDPIVAVLAYFETAELPLAQQALALAQAAVRRRTPGSRAMTPKKTKPKTNSAEATAAPAN